MTVGESVLSSHPDLSELVNTLARKCRGLPLALLAFARAVAGFENPRQWHHTIELSHTHPSEITEMGGHVFPLLKSSYDNLKEAKYQTCFLYCSLFPEDYNIRIDELIDLWVGEGFLDGSNPCDEGVFMVEALKSAYLLETDESKQYVRVHGIFRHLALWLARDQGRNKNKVLVTKSGKLTDHELIKWKEPNWISFFGCISIEAHIHSPSCPYLTTLLLKNGRLESLPGGFFDSMPVLRVLNLSGNRNLVELPPSIGNAKTLQYLNLSFTSLAELPMNLGNLSNLKCLLLDYTMNLKLIPKELISNLFLLQVYSKINGVDEFFGTVESLPCNEIAFLEALECLNQINKIGLISLQFTEEASNIERLQIFRCGSLVKIEVSERCKLGNLNALCIRLCPSLLNLNSLAYAINLESVAIFDCESLKEVTSEEMEFRSLKTISFTRLRKLERMCPSSRCFPSLLEIEVSECPLLSQLPFDLETANLLQKVRGEREWWYDLIWADEAVKNACGLKFVSTSFRPLQNSNPCSSPLNPLQGRTCYDSATGLSDDYLRGYANNNSFANYYNSILNLSFLDPCPIRETLAEALTLENMDVIKVISKGHGTNVQLVQHKLTGQFFALKIIEMETEESVHRQIAHKLSSIQYSECPHVVSYHDSFYNNGVISILLEYMDGGSLADFLKKVKSIPEPYIVAICKQVLKGLIYLHHEAHIIHRDIKPSKLLINRKGEVKITDFVESAEVMNSSGRANTFVATYNYMSPERIVGDSYGIDADIWSLGLVLLECATGKFPYSPPENSKEWTNFYELMECIVEGPEPYAPSDQFSSEFCSFISACLQKDPKKRMSAQDLLELPFMTMYDDAKVDLSSYFSSAGSWISRTTLLLSLSSYFSSAGSLIARSTWLLSCLWKRFVSQNT
ncbi:hypothetical protein V6N11_049452 [Hibiscus sabdariffa]|uniref:mitogen-activated protein kinase kinase n=1 Tax=Hibiscus sabdariffa TaxID=183260 RepID=A0ABR2NAB2_9ROSI